MFCRFIELMVCDFILYIFYLDMVDMLMEILLIMLVGFLEMIFLNEVEILFVVGDFEFNGVNIIIFIDNSMIFGVDMFWDEFWFFLCFENSIGNSFGVFGLEMGLNVIDIYLGIF